MHGQLRIGACLSLTGRFAKFGRQAALGLQAWRTLDGGADLLIEDDRSDRKTLEETLPNVAAKCDILLGPYSTVLMRAAGRMAAESGWLVWNQGGSGDDVEQAHPGHVVSVLTPATRYAEPFLRLVSGPGRRLCIVQGPGSFGRQVADGAAALADRLGVSAVRSEPESFTPPAGEWDLLSAGAFEQDAEFISKVLRRPDAPSHTCSIAAGVREFAHAVDRTEGVYGIAQWFPGSGHGVALGPREDEFLRVYAEENPDYPAVQAAAGALIAANCARLAKSIRREDLWAAAAELDTSTLFGGFRIDPATGRQEKHQTVLVRWAGGKQAAVPPKTTRGA
jgi:hypothetical protein